MPKIPWTPPKRPPRIHVEVPDPEAFAPVGENRCETCVRMGNLYKKHSDGEVEEIKCWVCKGSGEALPPPPVGDLHSDGSSIPWSGQ